MLEGRSDELKEQLIANVTSTVAETLGTAPSSVIIKIEEMGPRDWAIGGVSAHSKGS